MIDDDELRRMLQALASPVDEAAAWASIEDRMRRDTRIRAARRVGLGAAVVVIAAAITVAALPGDETRTDTIGPPVATSTSMPVTGDRWERLDSDLSLVPFAGDPVVVNTYNGLLAWGRTAQAHIDRDG